LGFSRGHPSFFDRIEKLAGLLAMWGARINLTAQALCAAELAFHLTDSLMPLVLGETAPLENAFRGGRRVADFGAGAGFPGLVLASAAAAHFTLVESRRKRVSFLTLAVMEIGLTNVEIDSRRIGVGALKPMFDVVTARGFAPAPLFHSFAAKALKPGGLGILYANPGQDLDQSGAGEKGLGQFQALVYAIARGSRRHERLLALWQRS